MKNGSMGHVVHILVTFLVMFTAALLAYFFLPDAKASAQTVTNPYWCGSYWSSNPCGSNGYYNYGYQYPQYYQYGYPNYYQYGYNYYNQYQQYQYYYPQPTCSITFSYTNNPNQWYGSMYSQAIQLSWSSNYANSAYISGLGTVSQSGTRVVYPTGYTQYTMTVYGPGGSNTCSTYYQPQQYYQPYPPYYWNQYNYNYGYNYGYPYAW